MGKPLFEKIWANLLELRQHDGQFSILLKLHFHTENQASIARLIAKIHQEFAADIRFNIILKPVENWGGELVKTMSPTKKGSHILTQPQEQLSETEWFATRRMIRTGDETSQADGSSEPTRQTTRPSDVHDKKMPYLT